MEISINNGKNLEFCPVMKDPSRGILRCLEYIFYFRVSDSRRARHEDWSSELCSHDDKTLLS